MTYLRSTDSVEEIVSEVGVTGAILKLTNTAVDQQFFVTNATPEAAITANIGDIATDTVGGVQYIKATGTATNTGWTAMQAGNQDSFFQTGNTFTLTFNVTRFSGLGGNSLVATETLVSMPQFAGTFNGVKLKVVSNTLDGATLVKLRVNAANAGPSVSIAAAGTGVFSDTTSTTVVADDLLALSFDTTASTTGSIVIAGVMTRVSAN